MVILKEELQTQKKKNNNIKRGKNEIDGHKKCARNGNSMEELPHSPLSDIYNYF